jgi:autotransporter translocation and assembly factor TamB
MAPAVRIVVLFAVGLVIASATVLFVILATPFGATLIKPALEWVLGDALGGDAQIGSLKGRLPNELIAENVRLTADGADWLLVDRVEVDWRPLRLLGENLEIREISVDGAIFISAPPDREDTTPRGFELPETLPKIKIDEISLTNIQVSEALVGTALRFDGVGAVSTGGTALDARFNATSSGERDFVSLRILRTGDALDTELTIASKADGAIAAISQLGGAVYVEASGEGPLAAYAVDFQSKLGAFGDVSGSLGGDLKRLKSLSIDASARFGERLDDVARIAGPAASLSAVFTPAENGGDLAINALRSELGVIDGIVGWRNRGDALSTVSLDVRAALDAQWRPDLRRYLGDRFAVKGALAPRAGAYVVDAAVDAALLEGELTGVETDLRTYARGRTKVVLDANKALPPPLSKGAAAAGPAEILFGESVSGTSVALTAESGAAFKGDASYAFKAKTFSIKGAVSAPPTFLAGLDQSIAASGNSSAVVDIKGATRDFGGTIVATISPLRYGRAPFGAARVAFAFADMPDAPSGKITAREINGARRLSANFARSAAGAWRLNALDYSGRGFALKGSAALDPEASHLALDLAYKGDDDAEPWPGLRLAGAVGAEGSLGGQNGSDALLVRASRLSSGGIDIEGLSARAEGSTANFSIAAQSSQLTLGRLLPLTRVSTAMTAQLNDSLRVSLQSLDGVIDGAALRLSEPAAIVVGDEIVVDRFRAAIGERGSLSLDGALSRKRWRAKAVAASAPVAGAASTLDATLDLDTDKTAPASGTLSVSSFLSNSETARLSGRFDWDGKAARFSDDGANPGFDFHLAAPLRLTRAPRVRVDAKGPLSGQARHEGRLETIAAFLPVALQSLEGDVAFEGTAAGTLQAPRFSGGLTISKGAYTELSSGLSIVNIEARATAAGAADGTRIEFMGAGGGPGQTGETVSTRGEIFLGRDPRLSSKITLDKAKLSAGPVDSVVASGEIGVSGPLDALEAAGDLVISELNAGVFTPESTGLVDVNVVTTNDDLRAPSPGAQSETRGLRLAYAVRISGDDKIHVGGRGLKSEWRADARLSGTALAPIFLGDLSLRKGEINFAGRRFEMTRGAISFDALSPNDPALDFRAEREAGSGSTAAIVITGRARAPKVSLESSPALPPEDIMALILFDKPASELSALESLQVADGLAELSGIGPFGGKGVAGATRSALGLDVLSLDIDDVDSAASTLTVGKYVADGLFVSATQDARGENGSVRIEYEIDDSFTVETELRQDGDQTVSANWKHDF